VPDKKTLKKRPEDHSPRCYHCGQSIEVDKDVQEPDKETQKSIGIATKGHTISARKYFCSQYCKDRWQKSDSGE
jgi:Fe2+ or Zn2+ uptake regulation protein